MRLNPGRPVRDERTLTVATTAQRIIIDAGPLIAWFDTADAHHADVKAILSAYRGELLSTWPVLTEVCHLLPDSLVPGFLRWLGHGGLTLVDIPAPTSLVLADRMDKYADLPMDLADASLIWLAEVTGVLDVLTIDRRDFGIYRTARGKALRNLLDSRPSSRSPQPRTPRPARPTR